MTNQYRVKVMLVDFDGERAAELKSTLKIFHNSQGNLFFKEMLHEVKEGKHRLVYESNNDIDAMRVARTIARAGGRIGIDGLKEDEDEF